MFAWKESTRVRHFENRRTQMVNDDFCSRANFVDVMLRKLREILLLDAKMCYAAPRSTSVMTNNSRLTANNVVILSLVVVIQ